MNSELTSLDIKIIELTERVRRLRSQATAVFSAACAERISGFYQYFSEQSRWGNYSVVRTMLDTLWDYLLGNHDLATLLAEGINQIDSQIPHSDDFAGVGSTGAQDVCICVNSGIAWALQLPGRSPCAPEFALEILRSIETLKSTGYLFLGDDPIRFAIDDGLLRNSVVTSEITAQENDLDRLGGYEVIPSDLVRLVRGAAISARYNAQNLIKGCDQ